MMSPAPALKLLLSRKLAAFLLVVFTANPVTWSYVPWIIEEGFTENFEVKAFIGVCLLLGYYAFIRATITSIGLWGSVAVLSLCGFVLSWLYRKQHIDIMNPDTMAWSSIIVASMVLGAGMGWSIIRVRVSGQVDPNV